MSKGRHVWSCSKGVGDLGDASIPAANVSDIFGFREGTNVVNEVISGFDGVLGDGETQEIDGLFCKLEFVWVENTPIF